MAVLAPSLRKQRCQEDGAIAFSQVRTCCSLDLFCHIWSRVAPLLADNESSLQVQESQPTIIATIATKSSDCDVRAYTVSQ
jgi:hypothetical protein